jgi:hypothetical protein
MYYNDDIGDYVERPSDDDSESTASGASQPTAPPGDGPPSTPRSFYHRMLAQDTLGSELDM